MLEKYFREKEKPIWKMYTKLESVINHALYSTTTGFNPDRYQKDVETFLKVPLKMIILNLNLIHFNLIQFI